MDVSLGRNLIHYTIALLVLMGVTLTVAFTVGIPDSLSSTVCFAQLFGASLITGSLFVRAHKRAPTKSEKYWLVFASLAISCAMALLPTAGFMLFLLWQYGLAYLMLVISEVVPPLPPLAWLLIVVTALVLSTLPIWFGYGPLTRQIAAKHEEGRWL